MASRNASFKEGVVVSIFTAPLKWILAVTLLAFGLLMLVWVGNWIFVFKVLPEGVAQLQRIVTAEFERTVDLARLQGAPRQLVLGTSDFMYGLVFRTTGVHDMALRFSDPDALSIPDTIVRRAYLANYDAIEVAMLTTQLVGVRLAMLLLAVPALALVYLVATADGLTQRAIRRDCGGRESSSLYHRAKYLQILLLAAALVAALTLPMNHDPRWTLAGMAAGLAVLAHVQWTYYKKHV